MVDIVPTVQRRNNMWFSFTLEFIPGVDNDIADSLSRLCRNNMIDSPKEYSPEYILSALHIESYEPSSSQYSKIGMMHNSIVGHFGLERTLKRFKDRKDTWEYQRQHIRYYIDHCPCCQKNEHAKDPHSCTWFYNLDMHTNGMSQYRLHRSLSGPRIHPGHSRYFHSMGRIVSYY